MPRIELETPEAQELTSLVLAKLNDFGWTDNTVLANFIVVMVANDKTKPEIIEELNDILPGQGPEFADWLFQVIDNAPAPVVEQMQEPPIIEPDYDELAERELDEMDTSTRARPTESRAPGRLLQNAITSATRSGARTPTRNAPARVYDEQRHERRDSRERSTSPLRSAGGLTTRDHQKEDVSFRRTQRSQAHHPRDEDNIDARLGIRTRGSDRGGGGDRMQGRLGRIEDRLGKRVDDSSFNARERSWDRNSDYHDRRGGRDNNSRGRKSDALRDIESRLGPRVAFDNIDDQDADVPRQPASWSRNPARMLRVEAELTREAVADETVSFIQSNNIKRCKFWPNCEKAELCPFWHPKELCAAYPNCPNAADTCLYVHPLAEPTAEQLAAARRQALMQSMRNKNAGDSTANHNGSAMQMPFALGSQALQECKFGARCTRADCKFRHPEGDSTASTQQQQQQPCRFYPNCTKPNCPFYHPSHGEPLTGQDSSMGEAGSTPNTDASNRLPTPCRFGDMCTRPDCHFTHPRDGAASTMPMCKFNPCTRVGCPFRHGAAGAAGGAGSMGGHNNRTLILNGSKPKISERFAGAVVDESEVEKLHVPASTHWANGGVSHQPQQDQQQQQMDEAEASAAADMDVDM
ncbi:hypothetical protein BGZ70_002562 [Mortierella alpina]|uniref:C3H1-type domain-containing protein n=1 Tax=Mortierella alpina TaxID=64518 RepID=A0A9P6JDF3_MORAP|nr:hypothetical protein BGZ70_002562 [Mortierella alpina]